MKLRVGDLEFEVAGSPVFVRQTIEELPSILARLRGETPPRPASISMPGVGTPAVPFADSHSADAAPVADLPALAAASTNGSPRARANGVARHHNEPAPVVRPAPTTTPDDLESDIVAVLRKERRPLVIAAIRERLGQDVSGQAVRRVLERSTRVVASDERPATYRLR